MKFLKIYKIIINEILDTSLFEHAYRLKHVKSNIISKRTQIARHILKLICYNENENTNHWIKEIKSWLQDIRLESHNIKNSIIIDKEEFFKLLYEDVFTDTTIIKDSIDIFTDNYFLINRYFVPQTDDEIKRKLLIIYKAISEYLYGEIDILNIDKNLRIM